VTARIDQFTEQEAAEQRRLDLEAEIHTQIVFSEDPYLALPIAIRMNYTRDEYAWLPDANKANLIQNECEPEA
jgi:hypothetical protein